MGTETPTLEPQMESTPGLTPEQSEVITKVKDVYFEASDLMESKDEKGLRRDDVFDMALEKMKGVKLTDTDKVVLAEMLDMDPEEALQMRGEDIMRSYLESEL